MKGYDPAVLYNVAENTPAYEAGLRDGDHIVKVNGKKITFYGDYQLYMFDHEGDSLDIEYKRDGKKYKTKLVPELVKGYKYMMEVNIGYQIIKIQNLGVIVMKVDHLKFLDGKVKIC